MNGSSRVVSLVLQAAFWIPALYLAIHLRMGDFEGEWMAIERFDGFKGFLSALKCARDLADAHGIQTPILILTDNAMLRDHLGHEGLLNGFVTTTYSAVHTKQLEGDEAFRAMMSAFLDLRLLAEAICIISCPSGFPHTAVQWGQHGCALTVS
ncbi:hypothetical protein CEUSTIGMA_g8158.t1 [Chlamydomonas eustigma]|uniref:Uncharacterized protein n=1 Tax=Chlamydomonas eustigma TaxID=1157962 RepID=A0A250XCB0_9CHLO|nr:hypothetical protein CEUSTIGMA_g8158.t1 [Chlamydomonas eustigma]|eukprot:GAX80723.1 hypothetical protein CEUSTIGMA_g8158.t1 [Chlamydomonas eustigma]